MSNINHLQASTSPASTTRSLGFPVAALVVVVAIMATLLTPIVGGTPTVWAATSGQYEVVLQDGEYLYVLDNNANTKTWASHCADELGSGRAVTWDDLKDVEETETPSCDVLVEQVGTGATAPANQSTEPVQEEVEAPAEPSQETVEVPAEATAPEDTEATICADRSSDPDGDGYGWENNATCLTPPPAAPSSVSTASVKGGVLVTWPAVEFALGYNVYRDGDYLTTVVGVAEYRDIVDEGTYSYSITSFGPTDSGESPVRRDAAEDGRSLPSAVLSLGDSFISGEGGRWMGESPGIERPNAYDPDTNRFGVGSNLCHRSDVAPIEWLEAPGVEPINIACSGAVGNHVLNSTFQGEQPQILQLEEHVKDHHLDIVAISIGGNDMGFGKLVEKCVKDYANIFRSECEKHRKAKFEGNIDSKMVPKATDVVAAVKRVMAEAGQPEARIVLLSYPSAVPNNPRWRDAGSKISHGCPFHTDDMRWLRNGVVPTIDDNYAKIAANADIEFLSLSDAFDGKENCGVGVTSTSNTDNIERMEWTVGIGIKDNERIPESIHPNALGQEAIGRCLELVRDTTNTKTHKCLNNGGAPQDMRLD